MTAATFDTHATVKVRRDAGIGELLAESIVSVPQMSKRYGKHLVTKAHMNTALENFEERVITRMTIRMGLMVFAVAGLSLGAAKLLF